MSVDFGYRHKLLADRVLSQDYEVKCLKNSLKIFYGRYPDLIRSIRGRYINKLRWRARYGDTGDDPAYDSEEDIFDCFKLPSGKDAPRSSDQALELFLELVENDLFHPYC